MPPFKQVESLKNLCEEALVKMVFTYEQMLVNNMEELKYGQETDALNDEQQYLLLWYLPNQLYTDLVARILKIIKEHTMREPSIVYWQPISNYNYKVELMQLFLNKKLEKLECIDLPTQMVVEIEKRFNFLEEITHFHVDHIFRHELIVMLIPALSNMKNLASFTLKHNSIDGIIRAISNFCPNLHSLDISHSRNVTNINCLQKCKKLKKLILFFTNVPYYDVAQFLLENRTLSELGMTDEDKVFEYLMYKQSTIQRPSTLKRLICRFSNIEELKFACSYFPYLQTIECKSCHEMDCSYLKLFKHLKELKCYTPFYNESLSRFLQERGSSLTFLDIIFELSQCGELIYDLMEFCPNLKFLKLFLGSAEGQKYENKLRIKQSWNLEKLQFFARGPTNNFELILMNTPNIKCVEIFYSYLDDDALCNILSANPMTNLEELTLIKDHNRLSVKSLRLLLTSCPKLKVIRNLKLWGITHEEIKTLERDIKYYNWDLNITSKSFYSF